MWKKLRRRREEKSFVRVYGSYYGKCFNGPSLLPNNLGLRPLIARQNYQKYKKIDWPTGEKTFTRLQHPLIIKREAIFKRNLALMF